MSDDPSAAAGNAAGENGAVDDKKPPAGDAGAAGAADATLLGGDDQGADAGAAVTPSTWREDWRETLAAGDAKELARLKRFSTPENVHRAWRQAEKLASGQAAPPEDATEAEIAQFRKTAGIPEKPEGYGLAFPEGIKPTEVDTALLTRFAEHMHGKHASPAFMKAAVEWQAQVAAEAREARAEFVREAEAETRAELRREWGPREFERSLKIRDEVIDKYVGDGAGELVALMLADGRPLGKHPALNRFMVAVGRATIDSDALDAGDGGGGGKSREEEKAALVAKSISGTLTKTEDARLNEIYEQQTAREERAGRGRAA